MHLHDGFYPQAELPASTSNDGRFQSINLIFWSSVGASVVELHFP